MDRFKLSFKHFGFRHSVLKNSENIAEMGSFLANGMLFDF